MEISDWLDRSAVVYRSSADSKSQALAAVAQAAGRALKLKISDVFDALMEREALGSTGVGRGVALPHARLPGLERMRAVVVRLERPVPFDAMDGQPVDILVALFAPVGAHNEHLRALARVARRLRQHEVRDELRKARSPDAIYAVLTREAEANAA